MKTPSGDTRIKKSSIVICCDQMNSHQKESSDCLKVCESGAICQEGCCGGCYVMADLKFCPWCGEELEVWDRGDEQE